MFHKLKQNMLLWRKLVTRKHSKIYVEEKTDHQNSGCNTKLTAKLESNVSNEEKSKRKVNSPSISIFIREDFIPR